MDSIQRERDLITQESELIENEIDSIQQSMIEKNEILDNTKIKDKKLFAITSNLIENIMKLNSYLLELENINEDTVWCNEYSKDYANWKLFLITNYQINGDSLKHNFDCRLQTKKDLLVFKLSMLDRDKKTIIKIHNLLNK